MLIYRECCVSPNQEEDLKFEDAKNNLNTKEQKAKRNALKDIIEKVDHDGDVCDVIGDTREWGAEVARRYPVLDMKRVPNSSLI